MKEKTNNEFNEPTREDIWFQEEKLRELRLYEMSRVRKFKNDWFYTRPSSDTPVPGARNEHLPPHIKLLKNNNVVLKVKIPKHMPKTIADIVTRPDVTNSEKRDLVKWFNNVEHDKTFGKELSAYELSILFWNRDNEQYEIEYEFDEDGNIITKFPRK